MSWNIDDMSRDFLRSYTEREIKSNLVADDVPDTSTMDDDIDDNGVDRLTLQPVLSSWMQRTPWAQDDPGVKVADASGWGEAALTVGSGLAASVPAGLAGLAELARGNGMEEAAKTIEGVQEWLTVLPKTPEGKKALEQLVPLLEKLSIPAQAVGGAVLDATGSPAAATAAEIVLDPLNYAVPAAAVVAKGAAKMGVKAAKRVADLPMSPVSGTPKAKPTGLLSYADEAAKKPKKAKK